jgi:ParB-like chromosome segregation protein Spo0J
LEPTTAPEPKLQIRRASIEGLRLDPSNARLHDEANLTAIRASLQRFGQVEPLLINSATKQIVAGHGRLQAMKALGWSECDVVELDLNSIDATALAVALNRSAELATWDEETLAKLLASLKSEDALDGVGFSDSELDELLAQFDDGTAPRLVINGGATVDQLPRVRGSISPSPQPSGLIRGSGQG